MLRPDGLVKVLDFGLAKLALTGSELADGDTTATLLHTDPGTVVGTVTYMSPEQTRGQDVDGRTDVWSLGVLLYEMVAGRSPFTAPSSSDVLAAILERAPDPLARFEPEVPHELQRIVSKALRKDRDQRYQTIRDLHLDLQALSDDLAAASRSSRTSPPPRSESSPENLVSGDSSHRQSSAEYVVQQVGRHKVITLLVALAGLGAFGAGVWRIAAPRQVPDRPSAGDLTMRRLTANPSDLPLSNALISPDGRYLAYADATGIQIRIIDTGETQRLPDTKGLDLYGWSNDSSKVRAQACEADTCVGWSISLLGNSRFQTDGSWPVGEAVVPLADGSGLLRYALGNAMSDLKLQRMDGTAPQVIARGVYSFAPGADSANVLYIASAGFSIESVSVNGGPPKVLWRAPEGSRIVDLVALPAERIIVVMTSDAGTALFGLRGSRAHGITEPPRRLTEWRPEGMFSLSGSADGTRLVVMRDQSQQDVYVADFDAQAGTLTEPRRFTNDERDDSAPAWAPDSSAVFYASNRNGNFDIFRQHLAGESPEPAIVKAGDQVRPEVTGDGRWLLYFEPLGARGKQLMRVPVSGGIGQPVCIVPNGAFVQCPAHGRCILFERQSMTVSALDPIRGKGPELAKLPAGSLGSAPFPDGESIAFVLPSDTGRLNRIHITALNGGASRDVVVKDASVLNSLDALSTRPEFVAVDATSNGTQLLLVRLDGSSRTLWSRRELYLLWAIPSPDDKHLAISANALGVDAWMITGF